jgi:hypothetical protein
MTRFIKKLLALDSERNSSFDVRLVGYVRKAHHMVRIFWNLQQARNHANLENTHSMRLFFQLPDFDLLRRKTFPKSEPPRNKFSPQSPRPLDEPLGVRSGRV